jgi:hypothetical protein
MAGMGKRGPESIRARSLSADLREGGGETIMHSKRVRDGIARILKRGILD